MKQGTKVFFVLLTLIALAFTVSCYRGPEIVPTSAMLAIPASLTASSAAGAPTLFSANTAVAASTLYFAAPTEALGRAVQKGMDVTMRRAATRDDYPYYLLQDAIDVVDGAFYLLAFQIIVVDVACADETPSSSAKPTKSITFSADMAQAAADLMPELSLADFTPLVGTNMTIPSFTYASVSDDPGFSYRYASDYGQGLSVSVSWDVAKTKVKVKYALDEGEADAVSIVTVYNTAAKTATLFYRDEAQGSMKVTLKQSGANNGAQLAFTLDTLTVVSGVTNDSVIYAYGFADDEGGYVQSTYTRLTNTNAPAITLAKEAFTSAGALSYYAARTQNTNEYVVSGTYNDTTIVSRYASSFSALDTDMLENADDVITNVAREDLTPLTSVSNCDVATYYLLLTKENAQGVAVNDEGWTNMRAWLPLVNDPTDGADAWNTIKNYVAGVALGTGDGRAAVNFFGNSVRSNTLYFFQWSEASNAFTEAVTYTTNI